MAYSKGKTILYNKHGDGYIPVSNGLSDTVGRVNTVRTWSFYE